MSWRPVDCHAHSTFSDGLASVAEVIARGEAQGVRPSLSDHVSRDIARSITSVDGVRAYLDALEQTGLLRGAELCWHDTLWRELPPDVIRRLTHRIGSLHAVRMPNGALVPAFARALPDGLALDAYMNAHIDSLETLAREMPVDILAHPTLVTVPFRDRDPDELWTEERETRLVNALFDAGIAFEVSARYPVHERLVRRAFDRGVRLSLGSDGHTVEQVGDLRRPLALTRAVGVPDEELYDPLRHGSRTAEGLAVCR